MTDLPSPAAANLEEAERAVREGLVVAIPTDTVYGLAADPRVPGATERLFAAKRRPDTAALPVLVAGVEVAEELGRFSPGARRVAEHYWPGALTIVVERAAAAEAFELRGDPATIGLRAPAHPTALALLERVGPLAVTSANLHGEPPLTTPDAIRENLGDRVAAVVDGGVCGGQPSTVASFAFGLVRLLRAGAVPLLEIERLAAGGDEPEPEAGDASG